MGFVGIDVEGAHRAGAAMGEASNNAEEGRRRAALALTLAELGSDAPLRLAQVADDLARLGGHLAQKAGQAESFTVHTQDVAVGLPEVIPGAAIAEAPPGLPLISPFTGARLGITVLGDSFISGEGLLGEDAYAGLGSIPAGGVLMANRIHQAHDSGALLAVRDLQLRYPEAEIRITYTSEGSRPPRTFPPLVETLGPAPVINVRVAAESGATIDTILGRTAEGIRARNLEPDSPWDPQIDSVTKDTDITMLSVGGNTRIRPGDTDGGFSSLLTGSLTPFVLSGQILQAPWNWSGADEARELSRGIFPALVRLQGLLHEVSDRSAPWSETIFTGYPYFMNGFDEKGEPLPLPSGLDWPLSEFSNAENRASVQFWETMNRAQAHDARFAEILPGQRITYLPQRWDNTYTLTGQTPAVNGFLGHIWAPDARSFHPNATGQDLYRQLFLPELEAAGDRIWGTRPEYLSPFDTFGPASELRQHSTLESATPEWNSTELKDSSATTELAGLTVVQAGPEPENPLPPGLYGAYSPSMFLLSPPEIPASFPDTTESAPLAPIDSPWTSLPAESWSLGDSALDLGSGGFGDVDFGAIEMYSGESYVSTSGFDD